MTGRRLPKYCSEFADRHGKMRVRFRRKGYEGYYFKGAPWSAEFMAEYDACLNGEAAPKIEPGRAMTKAGTISALITLYYQSPKFRGLAESSRITYRRVLEHFRKEHGDKRVKTLQHHHIAAIIGAKASTPAAANNLLDRLKVLMKFAVTIGMRQDNPAIGVEGFRIKSDGFHTWTEAEIRQFENHHPIGSKARLAMGLLVYTGQRRSDMVRMGRQHLDDNRISVAQIKTKKRLKIPIHKKLAEILEHAPNDNLTFLTTSFGRPFTPNGFGNWFREQCNDAGLPHCAAHGLRKAASRRLAEAGCSNQIIKAITGHTTDKEISRYTEEVDQELLAEQGIQALERSEQEQEMSNFQDGLDIFHLKSLKSKEK